MKIQWLKPAMPQDPPYLCVFRNCFDLGETTRLDFRYSADERCVLYCDGVPVARGPERGTPQRWFTGRVEITLPPGEHILTAALYCFGPTMTAYGQMSVRHGFLPLSDNGVLTPHWEYQYAPGCCFLNTWNDWASYPHILTDEDFNWEIFSGRGGTWSEPETFCDERTLASPELPPMRQEEITNYQRCGSFFLFPEYVVVYGEYEFSVKGEAYLADYDYTQPLAYVVTLDKEGKKVTDVEPVVQSTMGYTAELSLFEGRTYAEILALTALGTDAETSATHTNESLREMILECFAAYDYNLADYEEIAYAGGSANIVRAERSGDLYRFTIDGVADLVEHNYQQPLCYAVTLDAASGTVYAITTVTESTYGYTLEKPLFLGRTAAELSAMTEEGIQADITTGATVTNVAARDMILQCFAALEEVSHG